MIYEKTSGDLQHDKTYGIGPNIRYYLHYEQANPFLEAGFSYLKSEFGSNFKTTAKEYSIGAGLDFFISKNVSIEPVIKYSWRDYKDHYLQYERDENTLYVGVGINIFIF